MRINTLVFDANLPTTQQVNVPTNTDYRVGMKVTRNGEVQQLGPDEFTIYTGETSTVEEQMNTTTETLAYASYSYSKTVDIPTEMVGMEVDANDVVFQVKENGEWTSIPQAQASMAQTYDPYVQVKDGNTVLYTCHFKDYPRQWVAADSSTAQKITFETGKTLKISIYSANCFNPPITGNEQNIDVRVAIIGRREEKVTIPTDADKTNGYVTFTQAAGDNASFRQLKVAVEHGYDFNDYTERYTGQFPATSPDPNPSIVEIKASDLGLTGHTLKAEDYKNASRYYWRKAQPVPADLSAWTYGEYLWPRTQPYPPEQPVAPFKLTRWGNRDVYIMCPANDTTYDNEDDDPNIKGRTAKKGVYYFYITNEAGTKFVDFVTEHTFAADDYVLISPALRFTANYYYGNCYKMTFGTPFTADFKLNVNEFKSQCGDLNVQTDPEFSTAKVEGTYEDGTEFSFDFCIQ